LGRYSENQDLDGYWEQILESFQVVLGNDDSPRALVDEVKKSMAKFNQ
jgi:hypothetical protein